jgi:two-component system response regulator ChvI
MNNEIALVDDDRNILTSVSIALQAEGFVTRVYTDPTAALKAFADKQPDLGVFDIKMPHMDGMELLRRVREFSAMPVIFLTSKDDELDEALGLAMGADDYISKPFSQRLLIARIRALLRRQELAKGSTNNNNEPEPDPVLLDRGRLVMDPARHKVIWGGGRRLSRRRLCRRPHDRQSHQANAAQVPSGGPEVRRYRDALRRGLQIPG